MNKSRFSAQHIIGEKWTNSNSWKEA